jgi:general secretion pathway protein D
MRHIVTTQATRRRRAQAAGRRPAINPVLEHRPVYPRSRNRGFASHGCVAPRSLGATQLPRRALPCSQLRAFARSGKPVGALAALAAALALFLAAPGQALAQGRQPAQPGPPAPQTGQPAQNQAVEEGLYSCGKARGPVSVSFKPEVGLTDLITWAMGFTCKNFVYGAGIGSRSSQVTIIAPKRMSPQQAWSVFLVALQTMNLTVVPQGNVLTIVETAQASQEPLPIYRRGAPPATAQLVRMVVRPEHMPADELARAIDGIKSQHGKVVSLPSANMLIVTDTGSSINKMRTIIAEVDQPLSGERLYLIRVRHADATELANKLTEILGTGSQPGGSPAPASRRPRRGNNEQEVMPIEGGGPAGNVEISSAAPSKIIPEERTNSLIVLSSEAGYLRVRSLVQRLDVAIDGGGSGRIHVYPLEHGDAEEMANTLTAVITGMSQMSTGGRGSGGGNTGRQSARADDGGGLAFEGQVRVTHDKPTNALVVVASVKDFFALKDVIERLDTPRRQVFIEATIMEVQTTGNLDLGTSFHAGTLTEDGTLLVGGLQTPLLKSIDPRSLASATGLIGGALGEVLNTEEFIPGLSIPSFGVLVQALASSSNVNVLSSPHILTTDNEEAEISVGQNIPYQAGITGLPGGGQNIGFPVQSVQRQDVALTLKITPHINASDMVRLEIDQEISDVASPDFGGRGLGPSWSKRTVKTTVVVRDQQSIVIGGLMSDRVSYTETKIPLLGDVPLLGYLFKYTRQEKIKTNLLILLTPYVIKGQMDIEQIVQRKTRESQEFARTFANFEAMEYRPEIDYRRKRGLLEEINRASLTVERDVALLREAAAIETNVPEGLIEYAPAEAEPGAEPGAGINIEVEAGVDGAAGPAGNDGNPPDNAENQ